MRFQTTIRALFMNDTKMVNFLSLAQFSEDFERFIHHRGEAKLVRSSSREIRDAFDYRRSLLPYNNDHSCIRDSGFLEDITSFTGNDTSESAISDGEHEQSSSAESFDVDEGLGFLASEVQIDPRFLRSLNHDNDNWELRDDTSITTNDALLWGDVLYKYERLSESCERNYYTDLVYEGEGAEQRGLRSDYSTLVRDRSLYDAEKPDSQSFKEFRSADLNPSRIYTDSLELRRHNFQILEGLRESNLFKNNLASFITDHRVSEHFLVVACHSSILVYKMSSLILKPMYSPLLRFDTRPLATARQHIAAAVSQADPHTINYVKSSTWMDNEVLAACTDDGRVLVWETNRVFEAIRRKPFSPGVYYSLRFNADYELPLGASCWCVDFGSATNEVGVRHHIVVGSSNARTVHLFYFNSKQSSFEAVESQKLKHNIPEVSILRYNVTGSSHEVEVCVACISGEVGILKFSFTVDERMQSKKVTLSRVIEASDNCWTAKPIPDIYFKPVSSYRSLTGLYDIDEKSTQRAVHSESSFFCHGPIVTNIAAGIRYFQIPTIQWKNARYRKRTYKPFDNIDDEYRRIKLSLSRSLLEDQKKYACDYHIAVSTPKQGALLRGDSLLCVASTEEIFELAPSQVDENDFASWVNRISITLLIPELSAFVLATQAGLVTIMRLCQYNGHFSMRQEYVIPVIPSQQDPDVLNILNPIVGVTAQNVSVSVDYPRYLLCVIFANGKCYSYELFHTGEDRKMDIIGLQL
ncbi:hypothetical protein ACI3LY_004070 [Candidozyma auris]|nr:hypothetical protein QG37_06395 [[Candida] auris]